MYTKPNFLEKILHLYVTKIFEFRRSSIQRMFFLKILQKFIKCVTSRHCILTYDFFWQKKVKFAGKKFWNGQNLHFFTLCEFRILLLNPIFLNFRKNRKIFPQEKCLYFWQFLVIFAQNLFSKSAWNNV